jgi:hypothetical protein
VAGGRRKGRKIRVVTPINSVTLEEIVVLLDKMHVPANITVNDLAKVRKMKERIVNVLKTMR